MKAVFKISVGVAGEALKRGSRCPTLTALRQLAFVMSIPRNQQQQQARHSAFVSVPLTSETPLSSLTNVSTP